MKYRILIPAIAVCAIALLPACSADVGAEPKLETDDDKTLYALGLAISRNLQNLDLNENDVKLIEAGLVDGILDREPKVELETYGPKIDPLIASRSKAVVERVKAEGAKFLEKMAGETGAVKTDSGMIYMEVEAGSGESPTPSDSARVHYHGTLPDGKVFDSSREKGEPVVFPLNRVAPCFAEGLQRMKVGGKAKLICPSDLAYGDQGVPGVIPGGSVLVFEVELLEILPKPEETESGS